MAVFTRGYIWDTADAAKVMTTGYVVGDTMNLDQASRVVFSVVTAGTATTSTQLRVERSIDGGTTWFPYDFKGALSSGAVPITSNIYDLPGANGNYSLSLTFNPYDVVRLSVKRTGGDGTSTALVFGESFHPIPFDPSADSASSAISAHDSLTGLATSTAHDEYALLDGDVTFNSVDIGSTVAVSSVLDQDDMASNSATALATQQSIKAYSDNTKAGLGQSVYFGTVGVTGNLTITDDLILSDDFTMGGDASIAGDITSKGITWASQTSAADNSWRSITYGNGLFVAVAYSGSGNRVMTSPDGITWTSRTSAANNGWLGVTYGNGLFVAVSYTGTGDRVMTSPDGITWTSRTSAADNDWYGVTYGNGLFVAVSITGSGDRVMTSPDGITWTIRTSAADNDWFDVTYGNGLFVAVSVSGSGNRVMTSPDGITWTIRTSAADNDWRSVTYGNGLFVAVSITGTGDRVMTSPDGITWTSRTSAADNSWRSVTYGNGLFVAVSASGTGDRVMTSPDGITWTIRTSAADNDWQNITYGNGVFVTVSLTGTGDRAMTSGKSEYNALSHDNIYQGGMTIHGGLTTELGDIVFGDDITADGDLILSDDFTMGGDASIAGLTALNGASIDTTVTLNMSRNEYTTALDGYGINNSLVVYAAGGAKNYIGCYSGSATLYLNGSNFTGALIGGKFRAAHDGTGDFTNVTGIEAIGLNGSTGTVTNVYGVKVDTGNDDAGNGTLTNSFGVAINSPDVTGTVTNAYGLKVEDISGADTINRAIETGTGDVMLGCTVFDLSNLPSGATAGAASASSGEIWVTASHATLPDGVLMRA